MKLKDKIVQLRKAKGISQEELAHSVEVSRQAVYKWETGDSTPEVEKVKKLAEIFGVSLDVLLNDELGIDALPASADPRPTKPTYRDVFTSPTDLIYLHADYDHGFGEKPFPAGSKKKLQAFADRVFERKSKKFNAAISGYDKTYFLQSDNLVAFFIDEKRLACGIYFDGAEQFVCPFENLIGVQVSSDGNSMRYNGSRLKGSLLVGGITGVGVGVQSTSTMMKPMQYNLTFTYFNADGTTGEYTVKVISYRTYYGMINLKKTADNNAFYNAVSTETQKRLEEIAAVVSGLKARGENLRYEEELPSIDKNALEAASENAVASCNAEEEEIKQEIKASNKKQHIRDAIFWGSAAAFFIGVILLAVLS